jgi:acetoin utilization deacetylase AcuC-like enzyme
MKTAMRLDNTLLNELDNDIDEIIDYELDVKIHCYGADEIDYPLCTLVEYLKGSSKKDEDERFGMDDRENHNEFQFRLDHPMYGEHHCWLFHCLYDHNYLTWEEIATIQDFWVDIKPCCQYRFDTPDTTFSPPTRHLIYSNNYQSMFHDVVRDVIPDFAKKNSQLFATLRRISRLLWGDTARLNIQPLSDEELSIFHTPEYLQSLRKERRVIEKIIGCTIPSSITMAMVNKHLIDAYRSMSAGTIQAASLALQTGWAINLTGGFHRFFNDHAIAAEHLWKTNPKLKILYIDLDTVVVPEFRENLSYSKNFLWFGMINILTQIPLSNQVKDTTYLRLLREHLPSFIDSIHPDIFFYNAGSNVLENNFIGQLGFSAEVMKERDLLVFSEAKKRSVPIMMCLGSGYDQDNYHHIIESIEAVIEMMDEK